jgi:hypothetical protein
LSDIAAGLNKAIAEGAVAVAYVDRVVFEVQVASIFDGSAVICTRGETAVGRLTFMVAADLGVVILRSPLLRHRAVHPVDNHRNTSLDN